MIPRDVLDTLCIYIYIYVTRASQTRTWLNDDDVRGNQVRVGLYRGYQLTYRVRTNGGSIDVMARYGQF